MNKDSLQEVTVSWDYEKGVTIAIPEIGIAVTAHTVSQAIKLLIEKIRLYYQTPPAG